MKTIGIIGYKQSGKDTAAGIIQKALFPKTVKITHFADPLKKVALELGWDGKKDRKGRRLLQLLGTNVCRECICDDYWILKMVDFLHKENAKTLDFLLIPDLRFPNEAKMLENYYSELLVIKRPIKGLWRKLWFWIKPRHKSEHYERWIKQFPHTVIINDGTIKDLEDKLEQKIQEWQEIP